MLNSLCAKSSTLSTKSHMRFSCMCLGYIGEATCLVSCMHEAILDHLLYDIKQQCFHGLSTVGTPLIGQ